MLARALLLEGKFEEVVACTEAVLTRSAAFPHSPSRIFAQSVASLLDEARFQLSGEGAIEAYITSRRSAVTEAEARLKAAGSAASTTEKGYAVNALTGLASVLMEQGPVDRYVPFSVAEEALSLLDRAAALRKEAGDLVHSDTQAEMLRVKLLRFLGREDEAGAAQSAAISARRGGGKFMCASCGARETIDKTPLLKCGGCSWVCCELSRFAGSHPWCPLHPSPLSPRVPPTDCSVECQRQDWRERHKAECKQMKAQHDKLAGGGSPATPS